MNLASVQRRIAAPKGHKSFSVTTGYLSGLIVVCILSFGQRAPIVAVSPVLDTVASDLGVGSAVAGAVVAIPLVCFAVASPLSAWLIRRLSVGPALIWGLVLIAAGCAARLIPGAASVFGGAVALGFGVTILNIGLPTLVSIRVPPEHHAAAIGIALATLNIGVMVALAVSIPINSVVGWRLANAFWAAPALLAIAAMLWSGWFRRDVDRIGTSSLNKKTGSVDSGPRGYGVLLGITFGGQAFAAFAVTAWLAVLLRQHGGVGEATSGLGASLFQLFGIFGAFAAPILHRLLTSTIAFAVIGSFWLALPLGLIGASDRWPIWVASGGFAQGLCIAYIFVLIVKRHGTTVRLSAQVQTIGYAVGSSGPPIVGWLSESSWDLSLLVIAATIAVMTGAGIASGLPTRRLAGMSRPIRRRHKPHTDG